MHGHKGRVRSFMVDGVDLLLKHMDGKIKRAVYQSRKPIQQIIYFLINYNALKA